MSFAVLFLAVLALFLVVVAPFLVPILLAAFVVALLYPMNDAISRGMGGRRRLASLVSTFLVFLIIVIPIGGSVLLFVQQGIELVGRIQEVLGPDGIGTLLEGGIPEPLRPLMTRLDEWGAREQISKLASGFASSLAKILGAVLSTTANVVIALLLGFVAIFYFFADGHRILRELLAASPLEREYMEEFLQEVRNVSQAMILVNFVTGFIQGSLGVVSFVIVGLPSPVVWGALMFLFSFVPMVGTAVIWVPAGVILLLTGRPFAGIFVLAWGMLVIGTVDNLLRPYLAKGRIDLHPLLVFLTIFGGLAAFGPIGVVLGPMIGSIFTAMVRIWKRDFVPRIFASE